LSVYYKAILHAFKKHAFNGPLSGTTQVSRYQKGKTNLDFTEARDTEWQWHQLDHMQVCTSLQTDNHASTPPLFLQAGCPSCHPTNSIKALKAIQSNTTTSQSTECLLFTQLLYGAPVILRNSKPLTVARSNINVDCTETVVLLVTYVQQINKLLT